jgi:hypothetical protein
MLSAAPPGFSISTSSPLRKPFYKAFTRLLQAFKMPAGGLSKVSKNLQKALKRPRKAFKRPLKGL